LLATLLVVPVAIHVAPGWGLAARIALGVTLCIPAGFMMGMPFVAGLRSITRSGSGYVAWAWAINGAASGVSGVLSAMIGLTWGLSAAMAAGLLAYTVAVLGGRWVVTAPGQDRNSIATG
jgi:hypothetical protein